MFTNKHVYSVHRTTYSKPPITIPQETPVKMKATIFSLAAILAPAVVLAQTATTTASGSTSSCAADYIVESCLGTEEAKQEACGQQDYSCQCAAYEAIVT